MSILHSSAFTKPLETSSQLGLSELHLPTLLSVDVVICGFPRSGSSLLYLLLESTSNSHIFPVGEFSYEAVRASLKREVGKGLRDQQLSGRYGRFAHIFDQSYPSELPELPKDRPFVVKQPYNIFRASDGLIGDEVPLIITVRDPRDILVSYHSAVTERGTEDYFIDGDAMYVFGNSGEPKKEGPGLVDFARAVLKVLSSRKENNLFLCRYEELVSNPDFVQVKCSELGIKFVPDRLFSNWNSGAAETDLSHQGEVSKGMGPMRKISPEGVGKWKRPEYRERVEEQLKRFPELVELGKALGYHDGW